MLNKLFDTTGIYYSPEFSSILWILAWRYNKTITRSLGGIYRELSYTLTSDEEYSNIYRLGVGAVTQMLVSTGESTQNNAEAAHENA
jgi:hypothetical protein